MENVIELQHVHKSFVAFQLKDFSITVKKGFVTGFVGGNGVGKSTTIKLIMNLLQPDSGKVSLFGLNYKDHEKEIKQRIGFVFDENIFYESITLAEMKRIIKPSYANWDDNLFNYYVQTFELPLTKKIKTFSKGMMMKASLTIALSHHAELIIMDEPTSGLDPIFHPRRHRIHHQGPVGSGVFAQHDARPGAAPHHPAASGPRGGAAPVEFVHRAGQGHVAGRRADRARNLPGCATHRGRHL